MRNNYQLREACFVCSSPYQIMGAIGIAKKLGAKADLCVTKDFRNYRVISERVKKHDVFQNVYIADSKMVTGRGKVRTFLMTLFAEKAVSTFLPDDVAYKACYMSSRSTLKSTILAVLRKRNPDTERVVFEDGLGIYSDNCNLFTVSKLRRFIETVLGWDIDRPEKIRMMSYLPGLVGIPKSLQGMSVEQMPRVELDVENRQLFSDIFSLQPEQEIREKYIIFDTKRRGYGLDIMTAQEKETLDSCYEIIKEYAGNNLICKPHPKSSEKPSCDLPIYQNHSIPVEVLYMSMDDLGKRVLISLVSTAVFTPKIFFDSEPIVICLHRLFKDNWISTNFENIYEKFCSTYRFQERVMAPTSIDELRHQLSIICW